MKKLIYLADDEKNIRDIVSMFLKSDGYDVQAYPTGDELLLAFKDKPADLVILDIMMPGTDGKTICNQIRSFSSVPIIMLTAKDTDFDFIEGITLGSDDYITKPFRPTILNMRVKALLRRVELNNQQETMDELVCGDLKLSEKEHQILCHQEVINFTPIEYAVLKLLMEHFKEAVSRKILLDKVWGTTEGIETRVTDEAMRKIRKKLRQHQSNLEIVNIWGFGYKLIPQEQNHEKNE